MLSAALLLAFGASSVAAATCSCGYVMTKYNNAYFPYASLLSFSATADGPATSSNLPNFFIASGFQTGSTAPSGTTCTTSKSNVKFSGGALELVVPGTYSAPHELGNLTIWLWIDMASLPGGQKANGPLSVSCAEIDFNPVVTGGVFTMTAQYDSFFGLSDPRRCYRLLILNSTFL